VSLLIDLSNTQSSDNLITYTNNDMNYTIQHPSNWQVIENTESPHERVTFESSDRSLPIFAVNTEKVERHLDSDSMTPKNISLQQLAQQELDEVSSSEFRNFDLIRQNKVTVGGNDGWKMEFAGVDSFYLFEICTIANGKIYILTYQDNALNVPETLPLANKMVQSFQIRE
jgi:PsbP